MGVSRVTKRRTALAKAPGPKVTSVRIGIDDIYGGMIRARAQQQDGSIAMLAASIARHGLLQPVVVRRNARVGRYALVCGARRVLACRVLGMKEIDALLIEADEQEAAACFMEEHLTHRAPGFLDEAQVLAQAGVDRVGERCALPTRQLERRTRMLTLGERVRAEIAGGALTLEQAEPLLGIAGEDRQQEAASIIAQRGLTAQQARRLVFGAPAPEPAAPVKGRRRAIRTALCEATETAERLTRQGIAASVAVHSQERGMCIQIMLKNSEISGKEQEKTPETENKEERGTAAAT